MSTYMQYFFDHSGQVLPVVAMAILWLGFASLGGAASGAGRMRALDPLVGWAWIGFVFTTAGVFLATPFTYLAMVAAVMAAGACVWVWRRDGGVWCQGELLVECGFQLQVWFRLIDIVIEL